MYTLPVHVVFPFHFLSLNNDLVNFNNIYLIFEINLLEETRSRTSFSVRLMCLGYYWVHYCTGWFGSLRVSSDRPECILRMGSSSLIGRVRARVHLVSPLKLVSATEQEPIPTNPIN